jgi:tetratricopeptide (TPR) repeat protein
VSKFAYIAIDEQGNQTKGIVEAASEKEALSALSRKGLFPTELHKAGIADGLMQEMRGMVEADRKRRLRDEEKRQEDKRKRHPRQRLVVHYKDGHTIYGVSFHLDPTEESFPLDCTDSKGAAKDEHAIVEFEEIKAVFYVRSFDGKFDKHKSVPAIEAEGPKLIVEFEDGETLEGRAVQKYKGNEPRFFIVPHEKHSNNLNILVERSAAKGIYTREEIAERKKQAKEARTEKRGGSAPSQEETMGDFYFETRNYSGALEQFEIAAKTDGDSPRLFRKIVATKYNIGMQYIRRRDYSTALARMNEVLKLDSKNEHALKKVKKLRKILEHMEGE